MIKISPIRILEYLKNDLDVLKSNKFHSRDQELINIVFNEDLPELIEFARKVHILFSADNYDATGDYNKGYNDCYKAFKKEIYGT